MSETNFGDVLDILENSSAAVNKLNTKIPALEKKCDEVRINARELQKLAKDSEQRIRSATDDTVAKLHETEKKNEDLFADLAELEAEMEDLKEELTTIQQNVLATQSKIDAYYESKERLFAEMIFRIEQLENESDNKKMNTIEYLYNKYKAQRDQPIIVEKRGWTNDYCFLVNKLIREGDAVYAYGDAYVKGNSPRKKEFRADEALYHLYNGPSLNKILDTLQRRG